MIDDAELLRRYAETRDETAFTELVQRRFDSVYSIALRRVGGDAHLARDVSQQVFLALARDATRLCTHPVLAGWLHTATRHASANVVRGERRRKAREQEAQAMQDALAKGPEDADWNRLAPTIETTLDQLDDGDRVAVLLRFYERQTFAEIGRRLRLTEDAARKRVDRAMEKLRVLLHRRGISSTAAALAVALATHAVAASPPGLANAVAGTALAGAATGGGSVTFLTIMSMTKIQAGIAVGLIIAAAVGIVALRGTNTRLERELIDLRGQGAELARLRSENARLAQVEASNREAQSELTRLRGEIETLKNAVPVQKKKPLVTKAATPKNDWQPAGQATPVAALETLLAATERFDVAGMGKLIAFDPAERKTVEELFARVPPNAREQLKISTPEEMLALPWLFDRQGQFAGGEILLAEAQGPDDVVVRWRAPAPNDAMAVRSFTLHRGADGWQWLLPAEELAHSLADVRKKLLREVLGQQP